MSSIEALAVYGTLGPGEVNHWLVKPIKGTWCEGTVQGYVFDITWGPADGYPGFVPDDDGHTVTVSVIRSDELAKHLSNIDDFEGDGYERKPIAVTLDDGTTIDAWIYIALTDTE